MSMDAIDLPFSDSEFKGGKIEYSSSKKHEFESNSSNESKYFKKTNRSFDNLLSVRETKSEFKDTRKLEGL